MTSASLLERPDIGTGTQRAGVSWGFVTVVLLFTWVGDEFDAAPFLWYRQDIAGIPLQYLVIAAACAAVLAFADDHRPIPLVPAMRMTGLWPWALLTAAAVASAVLYGMVSASPELFADWRNLVVVLLVASVTARWSSRRPDAGRLFEDLTVGIGLAAAVSLVAFAFGAGTEIFGVRIPVFDGHKLFMAVLATSVGLTSLLVGRVDSGLRRSLLAFGVLTSSVLVVMSFRRSFWAAWLLAIVISVAWAGRRRLVSRATLVRVGVAGAVAVAVGLAWLGSDLIVERIESFLPSSENQFSATNEDHVNDVITALGVIEANPVTGLGIGRLYDSPLIADWKEQSFEVHNAPVHVWLKFGILGLVAYLGFHYRLARGLATIASDDRRAGAPFVGAAIFLVAEFMAQLVGTWPYGSVQMSTLHAVLIGVYLGHVVHRTTRRVDPPVAPVGA